MESYCPISPGHLSLKLNFILRLKLPVPNRKCLVDRLLRWLAWNRGSFPTMAHITRIFKKASRICAFVVIRYLFQPFNPAIVGSRAESLVRRLGFLQIPEPAEIIANYLRGYILFGRSCPYGSWFHWYWGEKRGIMTPATATVPKRLRSILRRGDFEFRFDQDVEAIIRQCREGREGWLTQEVVNIYLDMNKLGLVSTVGVYQTGQLVGGFWGLSVGGVFGIMSMFHKEKNAGAMAVAALAQNVAHERRWAIIDCGTGPFWEKFGARPIKSKEFSALVTSVILKNSLIKQSSKTELSPIAHSDKILTSASE